MINEKIFVIHSTRGNFLRTRFEQNYKKLPPEWIVFFYFGKVITVSTGNLPLKLNNKQ